MLLTASMGVVHAAQVAGLLCVGSNVVQVGLSYPIGAAAGRLGHVPIMNRTDHRGVALDTFDRYGRKAYPPRSLGE